MYNRIKVLRDNLKLSQKEFSTKLGIGLSTLGMIEVGKRELLERHINLICKVFNVNEEWLRNGTEPIFKEALEQKKEKTLTEQIEEQYTISPLAKNILEKYLALKEEEQVLFEKFVIELVKQEYKPVSKEAPVVGEPEIAEVPKDNLIEIKFYDQPISAGRGTYLFDDIGYELITVDNHLYPNVDFALRVSGDSMEPKYSNGDIVYVRSTQSIDNGRIGIFFYDGEGYLKKIKYEDGKIFLISLNSKYPPIEITNDSFKILGVVI